MTDYSWRAGSQADETAIVLKNCVGNACLLTQARLLGHTPQLTMDRNKHLRSYPAIHRQQFRPPGMARDMDRSEEHTSELQSLMRISYAVFCLKKKTNKKKKHNEYMHIYIRTNTVSNNTILCQSTSTDYCTRAYNNTRQ